MKKGQVTLFAIIAILLVSAVVIIIYIQREKIGLKTQINPEIRTINSFIESCIESTGEDALIFVGQQGGYYRLPDNSIDNYVYYFYNNKGYPPSKEIIEKQISLYINEMLPFCTKNFVYFSDFGIEADPYAVKTKTTILQSKIRFDIEWQVLIKKGATDYVLKKFSSQINSRLNKIYDVTANITDEQLKNPSSICLSCLAALAIENDFYIDMENYGNNTVTFMITDNQTLIKNLPYEFVFANKY